jgi:ATP-dependent Clp protease ATP-binding subunit ClpA
MAMANNLERFTNHSRQILLLSELVAQELGHVWIEPEHLMIAMCRAEGTTAFWVLSDADLLAEKLFPFLRHRIRQSSKPPQFGGVDVGDETKRMISRAVDLANQRGLFYIDPSILLIGLLELQHQGIEASLKHFQVDAQRLLAAAETYLAEETEDLPVLKEKPSFMNTIVESLQEFFRKKKNDE